MGAHLAATFFQRCVERVPIRKTEAIGNAQAIEIITGQQLGLTVLQGLDAVFDIAKEDRLARTRSPAGREGWSSCGSFPGRVETDGNETSTDTPRRQGRRC